MQNIETENDVSQFRETEERLLEIWKDVFDDDDIESGDSFLSLDGDSLTGEMLLAEISNVFGIDLELKQMIEHSTISEITQMILDDTGAESQTFCPVADRSINRFPVTFTQKRMWERDQQFGSQDYVLRYLWRLEGSVNVYTLKEAFMILFERHEALQICFDHNEAGVYQKLHTDKEWTVESHILNYELTDTNIVSLVKPFIREFDLTKDFLFALTLFKGNGHSYYLMMETHHIIADAWSFEVLLDEFQEIYAALLDQRNYSLPDIPVQFLDYAQWQHDFFTPDEMERQQKYWENAIDSDFIGLRFPREEKGNGEVLSEAGVLYRTVPKALLIPLKEVSKQSGVSLFATLLSAFSLLHNAYSNHQGLLIGYNPSGRRFKELYNTFGVFTNNAVVSTSVRDLESFIELQNSVYNAFLDGHSYNDFPYGSLLEMFDIEKRNLPDVYPILINIKNYKEEKTGELISFHKIQMDEKEWIKNDMLLTMTESNDEINLRFMYRADIFNAGTMAGLIDDYFHILETVVEKPESKLADFQFPSLRKREVPNV